MPTPQKAATIKTLAGELARAQLTIVTDYRGLKVSDLEGLRTNLRATGSNFRIAKNTLTTIAAGEAGLDGLDGLLAGPTGLVFAFDDPVQASKVVTDFVRTSRILTVRGGILDNQMVSAADIDALATLPSREELQARVLGMLISPLSRTLGVLTGPSRSLAYVMNARAEQLGGTGDAADAAEAA
jgi:large subunit ribosomal protein L10